MRRSTIKLAPNLSLPIDLATQTVATFGKRGSGKTNTAVILAEELHAAGIPFAVIDPVDVWWGLKASKDGRGQGLDVYVFGGSHADLPLEPTAGVLMADVLVDHRISAVLSVKHFTGADKSRFVTDFTRRLLQQNRDPLHVFLEEAHELAPERLGDSEVRAECLGAVARLWKLGRSSGIGGSAITQRPASLSKNITTQAEILVVHRTLGPQDVKAIKAWIQYHGESDSILGKLATLKTGEAFVWAPDFPEGDPVGLRRVKIRARHTFDSSATPKAGERRREPKALAPVDLERLRSKMADTIERAKATDPKALQQRIRELEREAKAAHAAAPDPDALQRARAEGRREALAEVAHAYQSRRYAILERLSEVHCAIDNLSEAAKSSLDKAEGEARAEIEVEVEVTPTRDSVQLRPISRGVARNITPQVVDQAANRTEFYPANAGGLTPARQKILNALAWLASAGVEDPKRPLVALAAGTLHTSSYFERNLGAMRSAGLIDYPSGGRVCLEPAGRALAKAPDSRATSEKLHRQLEHLLTPARWSIVSALIASYPSALDREALAHRADATSSSSYFERNLGYLRNSLELIDYPERGKVRAADSLFL